MRRVANGPRIGPLEESEGPGRPGTLAEAVYALYREADAAAAMVKFAQGLAGTVMQPATVASSCAEAAAAPAAPPAQPATKPAPEPASLYDFLHPGVVRWVPRHEVEVRRPRRRYETIHRYDPISGEVEQDDDDY